MIVIIVILRIMMTMTTTTTNKITPKTYHILSNERHETSQMHKLLQMFEVLYICKYSLAWRRVKLRRMEIHECIHQLYCARKRQTKMNHK